MPVRLSTSAVLKWPDRKRVLDQARAWAESIGKNKVSIRRVYCYGSIAGESWGVGSDIDLLVEVDKSEKPFHLRCSDYYAAGIDVPADVLVYTSDELNSMREKNGRFIHEFDRHSIILYSRE